MLRVFVRISRYVPIHQPPDLMYSTRGIDAVATITELRSNTSDLVERAKQIDRGILVQKNNEPYAVLLSYDLYIKLLEASEELARKRSRSK